MKKILFGLVLVLCGEHIINLALQFRIPFFDVIGAFMPVLGLIFASMGLFKNE